MQVLKETELKPSKYAKQLNLDYYIGKPLRDFLRAVGQVKVQIDFTEKDDYGSSGTNCMASQVSWSVADRNILEIKRENEYVDFSIVTE